MHPLGKLLRLDLDASIAIPAGTSASNHPASFARDQTMLALRLFPVCAFLDGIKKALALLLIQDALQQPRK